MYVLWTIINFFYVKAVSYSAFLYLLTNIDDYIKISNVVKKKKRREEKRKEKNEEYKFHLLVFTPTLNSKWANDSNLRKVCNNFFQLKKVKE